MGDRSKHIGGSDIGTILGLSSYSTAYELWEQKTKRVTRDTSSMATEAGHALEPLILDTYARETGRVLERQYPMSKPGIPWAGGTADAVCWSDEIVIDAKASCSLSAWSNGPPATVYCQMQWYMWMIGFERADVALLQASAGWGYTTFSIMRDESFIETAVLAASEFWQCVKDDVPPAPQTYEDVMRRFEKPSRKTIVADRATLDLIKRWREVADESRQLDGEKLHLRKHAALYMQDAEDLIGEDGERLVRSVHTKHGRQLRLCQ